MQRRAAAAYFAFFLVISVAAYAYIGVAESQQPAVSLDADAELTNESTFTVDGTEYTATNIHMSGGGGGHGGGGGSMAADLSWTNESSQYTATVEHNTTTTYQNDTYRVLTDSNESTVTLEEELNVSALLAEDSSVKNTLATQNGTEYVVYRSNNTQVPLTEWLPEPETVSFSTGDTYPYATDSGTQETTISEVTADGATLEWVAPRENTIELSEGGNVTLSGQQFFTHFPDHHTVQIVPIQQYDQYQATLDQQDYFHERKNGIWGVSILSGIAAVLMLGMAYMPVRG
ncbi:hypothetical protein SAMN05443574_10113 [Haloarcula vallismortis]|uniref:Uncharacterized protein n=2 Tax=Haloarcula vallismortis TaxID=28442 RepID=M0IYR7_HALVA|nr:hypothetical protein [Haloarcula vallismortis]EMA00595.1 hypothetical protein C437_17382 [Haloarcula vallismortis ATCC 29715]SDW01040.1 hypothetical protein SAMN05443574_10113 [Haloarcula vallismortis]